MFFMRIYNIIRIKFNNDSNKIKNEQMFGINKECYRLLYYYNIKMYNILININF